MKILNSDKYFLSVFVVSWHHWFCSWLHLFIVCTKLLRESQGSSWVWTGPMREGFIYQYLLSLAKPILRIISESVICDFDLIQLMPGWVKCDDTRFTISIYWFIMRWWYMLMYYIVGHVTSQPLMELLFWNKGYYIDTSPMSMGLEIFYHGLLKGNILAWNKRNNKNFSAAQYTQYVMYLISHLTGTLLCSQVCSKFGN